MGGPQSAFTNESKISKFVSQLLEHFCTVMNRGGRPESPQLFLEVENIANAFGQRTIPDFIIM